MQQSIANRRENVVDEDWGEHLPPSPPRHSTAIKHLPHHPPSSPTSPHATVGEPQKRPFFDLVGHVCQKFHLSGLFSVSFDTWKSCISDWFTHAGFFTYVQHHGAGYCTYTFVRAGCKIWGIHRMRVPPGHNSRRDIHDIMSRILRPHGILDYIQHTELYTFFLMKGDVL
jgi:hypothetical protein